MPYLSLLLTQILTKGKEIIQKKSTCFGVSCPCNEQRGVRRKSARQAARRRFEVSL